ncbi:helix-turn-helix domain-containing protein, partial [Arthrospira platensis SPKY1]|nr:helix-turn-helix domain-containing protein [Arthrospira platensis SPKY1]
MFTLDDIVDSLENLEMKRAIAVKMIECDFKTEDICTVLNVSDSFVSKWKVIYENQGARALKVNYSAHLQVVEYLNIYLYTGCGIPRYQPAFPKLKTLLLRKLKKQRLTCAKV